MGEEKSGIGLVLSGGGARGFAHFGVLQALDELKIDVRAVAGASAGAIAGAFWLSGYKPKESIELIRSYSVFSWMRLRWRSQGILSMEKVVELMEKYLPQTFEELSKPLTICATDILAGESVYYNAGPLVKPMCGSAALPVLFDPLEFEGRRLVDGGALNNLPLEPLQASCAKIIAVHVNPVEPIRNEDLGMRSVVDRTIRLVVGQQVAYKKAYCNVFIEPPASIQSSMFDLKGADDLFQSGYDSAMAVKDDLLALQTS
ncbi:MAG: patatin-like phospholipase family protein [Bacteroidia bacterium]